MGWCWAASVILSRLTEIRRQKSTAQSTKHCWEFLSGERRGKKNKGEKKETQGEENFCSHWQEIRFPQLSAHLLPPLLFTGPGSGLTPAAAPTGGAADFLIFARCPCSPPLEASGAVLLMQRSGCSGIALTLEAERQRGKILEMESDEVRVGKGAETRSKITS